MDKPVRDSNSRFRSAYLLITFLAVTLAHAQIQAATFEIGGDPDWMAISEDAVWVTSSKLNRITQLIAKTNTIGLKINVADPCSGLAAAFGSLWIPSCGGHSLIRADLTTGRSCGQHDEKCRGPHQDDGVVCAHKLLAALRVLAHSPSAHCKVNAIRMTSEASTMLGIK